MTEPLWAAGSGTGLSIDVSLMPKRLEPVHIEIVRECHFKEKPCALCGLPKSNRVHTPKATAICSWKRRNGCARCGRAKGDPAHYGAPDSLNIFAGRKPEVYRSMLDGWKRVMTPLLAASGLPKGLAHVLVEGEVSFGNGRDPDQGNHRVIVEKALGDALVEGGWLPSDTWSRYEFGGFELREESGVSATRLMIFPMLP